MSDADGHLRRNTTVAASGASTASTAVYCPLRNEMTPEGGKMILS